MNEWVSASTPNQTLAIPDIIDKNKDLVIKTSDPDKITAIESAFNISITNGTFTIKAADIGTFKIIGSQADDFTNVKSVVDLIN